LAAFILQFCTTVYVSGVRDFGAVHFQYRTEPIRLLNISNFPSIVKDELAVLQRRTVVELPTETRITFTFCCMLVFI